MAVSLIAARQGKVAGPVVLLGYDTKVCGHDTAQKIGVPFTPFIGVATAELKSMLLNAMEKGNDMDRIISLLSQDQR